MTPTFGRPRLVASNPDAANPSATGGFAPGDANTLRPALPPALPETLVDQLADALGAAEARCAALQRAKMQPVSVSPFLRGAEPASFGNAETAPFLSDGRAAPPSLPPSFSVPPARPEHAFPASAATDGWTGQQACSGEHHHDAEHDSNIDLPRFFDRDRPSLQQLRVVSPGASSMLSGSSMALGFVIGLAVIAPMLWLSHAAKVTTLAKGTMPLGLAAPMLTASTVATLVPAAALEVGERGAAAPSAAEQAELGLAAFEEAGRRIAFGDYMGARDALRQAVALGEDRARALLDALE